MTNRPGNAELPDSLRLPSTPVAPIPAPEALVFPSRADGREWAMSGRRARARITGVRGVRAVEGDGALLTGAVEVVGATGANALLSPRTTRREVMIPGGGLHETVVVPEALPGVVLQWVPSASGPRELPLRIVVPGPPDDGRIHTGPGLQWIGRGDAGVLLLTPGCEAPPELRRDGEEWVVRWNLPLGQGAVSLLVMAAPEGIRWASPTALAGAAAHYRRGEIMARGEGEPGVELDTGVEAMDRGILWTRAWLRGRLLTPPGSPPGMHSVGDLARVGEGLLDGAGEAADAPAWLARAATATGDWEAARGALSALQWDTPWRRLHASLALARYTAWTADGRPLEAAADEVRSCFGEPSALKAIPEPVAVAVWETVQAAAEAVEISALSGLPRPTPPPADRPRALPVLGSGTPPATIPTPSAEHPWLSRLGFAQSPGTVARARAALGEVSADPTALGQGLGVTAALELVEGMLGAIPDATFSRLALSPLLPPSWTAFRVGGVRTGEGILQVDYHREEDRAVWTLIPREGSVPLTAIFRPWMPWSRLQSVRVDDQEAALDIETLGGWTRLQVQIPVDGEHTVEVVGQGPRAETLPGDPPAPGVSRP